jgi:hypothetical protein
MIDIVVQLGRVNGRRIITIDWISRKVSQE